MASAAVTGSTDEANAMEWDSSNEVNNSTRYPEDMSISDFDLEHKKELGRGAFGAVYLVRPSNLQYPRDPVVLKIPTETESSDEIQKEMEHMKKIRMQYIVEVYGLVKNDGVVCGFIMEYMDLGSVYDVVKKRKGRKLPWALQLRVIAHTACGMQYLHENKMLHLDLKTPNILLNHICQVKLTDFGLAHVRINTKTKAKTKHTGDLGVQTESTASDESGPRGTTPFIAPEVLKDINLAPSRKRDVYAFAITSWEVLTGDWPFRQIWNDSVIIYSVIRKVRPDITNIPQSSSSELEVKDIMCNCWDDDPEKRPHFEDIVPALRRLSDEKSREACVDAEILANELLYSPGLAVDMANEDASGEPAGECNVANNKSKVECHLMPPTMQPDDAHDDTARHKLLSNQGQQMSSLPSLSPPSLYVTDELGVVSDKHLDKLAPYIAHRWEDFAHHLRLSPVDLAEIAAHNPSPPDATTTPGTPVLHVRLGLYRWKQRYRCKAIRKWILAVLAHMNLDLACILDHAIEDP